MAKESNNVHFLNFPILARKKSVTHVAFQMHAYIGTIEYIIFRTQFCKIIVIKQNFLLNCNYK